jgi:hypothetical protein
MSEKKPHGNIRELLQGINARYPFHWPVSVIINNGKNAQGMSVSLCLA